MKKPYLGALVAVAMIGGFATVADAKVKIYLGVPYYNYQVGPDYFYDNDYGWYQQRHHRRHHYYSDDQYDDGYNFYPPRKHHRRKHHN